MIFTVTVDTITRVYYCDLSQITLFCPRRYVTKNERYVQKYMDDLSQFWTICHNFILDDLSQVTSHTHISQLDY